MNTSSTLVAARRRIRDRLDPWLRSALIGLRTEDLVTDHLDVLGFSSEEYWSLPTLREIFAEGVYLVERSSVSVDFSLTLPLQDTDTLEGWPAYAEQRVDRLLGVKREEEPPSLYLLAPGRVEDRFPEEYRCRLHWFIPRLDEESYHVCLKVYRDEEAIRESWEYGVLVQVDFRFRSR